MKPELKAKELIQKMSDCFPLNHNEYIRCVECALVAAKECKNEILPFDTSALYYWDKVIEYLNMELI